METGLNNLIDKIKKEGVEQAEKDAMAIITQARAKAKEILDKAERKKEEIIRDGESNAARFKDSSEKAMKQAARDVLLSLAERATEFFDRVVKERVSKELSPETLKEMILKVAANFRKDKDLDIEVLLSDEDKRKLEKSIFSALSKEAQGHVTLRAAKNIEKGFRIGEKGKDYYMDFTDEGIAAAFKGYLNPKLAEILDIDLGLGKNNNG